MRYFWTLDPQFLPLSGADVPGTPVTLNYGNTNATLKLTTLLTNNIVNELHASGQRTLSHGSDTTVATPQSIGQGTIVPTQTELPRDLDVVHRPQPQWIAVPRQQPDRSDPIRRPDFLVPRSPYDSRRLRFPIRAVAHLLRGSAARLSVLRNLRGLDTRSARLSPRQHHLQRRQSGNTNGAGGNILECDYCVRSGPNGIIHNYTESNQDAFVQDDWKVSSRLTFNLGVRWEYDGTYGDKYGNLTNVSIAQLETVAVPPSGPTTSGPGLVGYVVPNNYTQHYPAPPAGVLVSNRSIPVTSGPPLSNFAPRFGFAWQPRKDGKLVIRGGVGMFYDRVGGGAFVHAVEQGDPYAVTLDYEGPNTFSNQNPYPNTPLGSFSPRWVNFAGCQPQCLLGRCKFRLGHAVDGHRSSHAIDAPV